jgi:hypothetical protein
LISDQVSSINLCTSNNCDCVDALIEQSKLIRIVLDARELRDLSALQQAIDAAEPSSKHRAAALQQVMDSVCNEQLPRAQLVDCSSRSMLRLHVVPGLIDQLLRTIPFKLYLEQTLECPLASVEWIEVDRIGAWPAILPHKLLQVKWEGSDAADYPAEDSKSPVERLERSVRDFIRFIQLFPRQRCLSLSALAEGCLIHYLRLTLFPTATINNSESVDRQIALVNQAITDLGKF